MKSKNIKSFLYKLTEYELVKNFFVKNDLSDLPLIINLDSESSKQDLYNFYLNLENEQKKNLNEIIEKLILLSNWQTNKIIQSFVDDKSINYIMADNYYDKALAFYLDSEIEVFEKVCDICSFYKVNSWKRFEAHGDIHISETNLDQVTENIKNKYVDKYYEDNKVFVNVHNIQTYFYDNKYFCFIDIKEDNKEIKRIYCVYIKEISEVLVKMSGNYNEVFAIAEMFIKKLTGYALDIKVESYDMNFINNYLISNNESALENIFANPFIINWRIRGINFKNKDNIFNLKFNKNDNSQGLNDLLKIKDNFNINISDFEIDSFAFEWTLLLSGIDTVKKKVRLMIKKNSSNINPLKNEHLIIYKMLKEKSFFQGFILKEL